MLSTLATFYACADDESFTTSPTSVLTMSRDTVTLDTIFSKVPSTTKTFWVHNKNSKGVRCTSIKLANGNQTGFRVNVNGVYLGEIQGYQISNEEIRHGDSIRVFVEATLPVNNTKVPQLIDDDLVFVLESGIQQKVNLRAWSWDAELLKDIIVSHDTIIGSDLPTVIFGGITVNEGATLTIPAGKTLYMHGGAQINVHGRLICKGEPDNEVVIRGDRLDNMFDYLKYDEVSGQWGGIRFHKESYDNVLEFTDIHATENAIVCDSSNIDRQKLTLNATTVHNAKGYGVYARNCRVDLNNTLISNTLHDCLHVKGGVTNVNNTTLAQFYPFDAMRGAALYITNEDSVKNQTQFTMKNSIATGYAEDVIMVQTTDTIVLTFDHCLLRTPEVKDTVMCHDIIWENPEDTTVAGVKNFEKIDIEKLKYDFHLRETSLAVDAADVLTSLPSDRDATKRDEKPDMGCYEAKKENESEDSTKN